MLWSLDSRWLFLDIVGLFLHCKKPSDKYPVLKGTWVLCLRKKINIDYSSSFARIVNVLTQKDWHLWVKGLQNYPKLIFYLKSWAVSFKFVRNQPLLFCNYPLIFNKFITILFVQQIDLVWRSQPQNLMLKILLVYRCFTNWFFQYLIVALLV